MWEPLLFATFFAVLVWRTLVVRTLRFPDRYYEQAFNVEFDGGRRTFDLLSVLLQVLLGTSGVQKYTFTELLSLPGLWVAINVSTALVRLWLILRRSQLYVRNRSLINTVVTCCTITLYVFWVVDDPLYLRLHPLELPYLNTWKALLLFPVMLAQTFFNYKAPLSYKSITSSVAIVLVTMVQASRCDRESALISERHEFYSSILRAVEHLLQNWMPLVFAGRRVPNAGEELKEGDACRAVHASLAVSPCSNGAAIALMRPAHGMPMPPQVHTVTLNVHMVPLAACRRSPHPSRH